MLCVYLLEPVELLGAQRPEADMALMNRANETPFIVRQVIDLAKQLVKHIANAITLLLKLQFLFASLCAHLL